MTAPDSAPLHPSGVWYCRDHHGVVNEDEPHDDADHCPWADDDNDVGCDWTELLYRDANSP